MCVWTYMASCSVGRMWVTQPSESRIALYLIVMVEHVRAVHGPLLAEPVSPDCADLRPHRHQRHVSRLNVMVCMGGQFTAPRWQNQFLPTGQTVGDAVLTARGLPTDSWCIWLGVGVLVFSAILFNVAAWLCHAYLQRTSAQLVLALLSPTSALILCLPFLPPLSLSLSLSLSHTHTHTHARLPNILWANVHS
jgi:hypothetical protein